MILILPKAISIDKGNFASSQIESSCNLHSMFRFQVPLKLIPLLVTHLYPNHDWIKNNGKLNELNIHNKSNEIIDIYGRQYVDIYLVYDQAKNLKDLKKRIRNYYKIDNASIHTTDSPQESEIILEFMKSIKQISKSCPNIDLNSWILSTLFNSPNIKHHEFDRKPKSYSVIVGSALLDIIGESKSSDIDFLYPSSIGANILAMNNISFITQ